MEVCIPFKKEFEHQFQWFFKPEKGCYYIEKAVLMRGGKRSAQIYFWDEYEQNTVVAIPDDFYYALKLVGYDMFNAMMARSKRRQTAELTALRLQEQGARLNSENLASQLNIHERSARRWLRKFRDANFLAPRKRLLSGVSHGMKKSNLPGLETEISVYNLPPIYLREHTVSVDMNKMADATLKWFDEAKEEKTGFKPPDIQWDYAQPKFTLKFTILPALTIEGIPPKLFNEEPEPVIYWTQ